MNCAIEMHGGESFFRKTNPKGWELEYSLQWPEKSIFDSEFQEDFCLRVETPNVLWAHAIPLNVFDDHCAGWPFRCTVQGIAGGDIELLWELLSRLSPSGKPSLPCWEPGRWVEMPNDWNFRVNRIGGITEDSLGSFSIDLLTPPLMRIPLLGGFKRISLLCKGPLNGKELRRFLGYLSTV